MLVWNIFPFIVPLAFALIGERAIETDINIYAYGINITGFQIYADSNSKAVIADNTTALAQGLNNITWAIDTKGSVPWNVTLANSSTIGHFYIMPSADESQGAGFNTTTPTGAVTTGFIIYGSTVEYSTATTYESQFYAQNSSTGVYNLMWNVNSESLDDGVPVVLKTIAPPSLPFAFN
ncbi:hypothetical protein F5Y03DRAFT_344101 [Xylaria venustula]|nr:hypothetical protein F5Y03DRAFT_344101 [Xylaria venustula]